MVMCTVLTQIFFVQLNKPTVVEVKQIWNKSTKVNKYNRFFEEKRKAIADFCSKRNYDWIWLDFDYDSELKKIYKII